MKLLGLDTSDMNISTLLQIGGMLVALAVAWGSNSVRLDGMDKDIANLSRALESERAERIAYQSRLEMANQQNVMDRALWMVNRAYRDRGGVISSVAAEKD